MIGCTWCNPSSALCSSTTLAPHGTLVRVSVSDEVIAAAEARARALAAGDASRLSALLHDGFSWTTHLGETLGKAEYVHRNTGGRTVWHSQQLSGTTVVAVGDTAVLHADVTDVIRTTEGKAKTFRMPITQVWTRAEGDWQCLAGHAGPLLS